MYHLQSLSVFSAVAEEKSFSAAAKKLHLTQPTVSFHIDSLEKQFGCPLFARTAKGVSLTIYGETLYTNTVEIHKTVAKTGFQLQSMLAGESGNVCIGASTIPGEYILPGIIASFRKSYPDIRFSLTISDSSSILREYEKGVFPIAIIGKQPPAHIPSHALWQDELLLVCHPDLPIQATLSIDQLNCFPFVMREEQSGTRFTLTQALAKLNLKPEQLNIVFYAGGNEALKSAIMNQIGIGFISRYAVQSELHRGMLRVITLEDNKLNRTFWGIHTAAFMPTCVAQFWSFLKDKFVP